MNMISTGAFLSEMDASNKQPTVLEKFAAVWEKKNAKAARAGGVSLMALSLAACGGSSSTTTTTTTDTTTDTVTTPVTPAAPTSLTLTLSTGPSDSVTGGDGDDTIDASETTGGDTTIQITDEIDGGAGTDTLEVTLDNALTYTAATAGNIKNVETLQVTIEGATNRAITLSDKSGADTFAVAGINKIVHTLSATNDLTVTDVPTLAELHVINTASDTTVTYATSLLTGSADSVTVNVNGVTGGVILGTVGDANGDYETLVINSTGAASTLNANTDMGADATSVVINATANFDMSAAGAEFAKANTVTVNGSGNTSIILADKASANAVARTVTGGDGKDTINISNITGANVGVITVDGGAGDDTVNMGGFADATAVISGGAGTDALVLTAAGTAANTVGITGFEALRTSADQVMSNFTNNSGILTFRITDGEADITNVASGAATLEIDDGANTDTPTLDRLIDGSDDALTIKMRDAVQNTDMNLADEETITIDASTSSLTTTGNFTTTDMTSLTVTGDNAVDLSTVTSTKIATVDVSGLDAAFTADFSASTKAMTVTGNSGTSAGAMSVTTGSGNDTLTGTSQADTIDVGNGSDTVRGGDGDDGITLGAGIDTIIFEATAAANDMDTLTNYSAGTAAAGGDILDFSAFIGAGSVAQNGGSTTAITVFTAANNDDTDITNKFAIFEAGAGAVTVGAAETALIGEINGGGDAFSIADNGKAIVAYGASDQTDGYIFYIDDSLDGTAGTIGAADVVAVMDTDALNLDTLITTNIDLVA